jgi:hypothetical protein
MHFTVNTLTEVMMGEQYGVYVDYVASMYLEGLATGHIHRSSFVCLSLQANAVMVATHQVATACLLCSAPGWNLSQLNPWQCRPPRYTILHYINIPGL